MTFAEGNNCTTWKTRTSVLIEADFMDEQEGLASTAELVRLHDDLHCGRAVDNDRITLLMKELGIKSSRTVWPRELRNRGTAGACVLSEPLGCYYTSLTIPYIALNTEEVRQEWDDNPIETVTVFGIPSSPNRFWFESARLGRTSVVDLGFTGDSMQKCIELLRGLDLQCTRLRIRNVRFSITAEQLKRVLRFPNLKNLELT